MSRIGFPVVANFCKFCKCCCLHRSEQRRLRSLLDESARREQKATDVRSLMRTRIHLKKLVELALTRQERRLIKMQRYSTVIESDAAG